ncbi:MAG: glycosyltransferase [Thermoanaerobaculia bacterium]
MDEHQPLKLDYVSPLPPVRSGIADYSADLLPHLAASCDLRLVHLPGQPVAEDLAGRWPLIPPERLGEGGRLPLYQMGNNHYHLGVYELAWRHPGVLTLHDMVLHHFLIDRTVKAKDFDAYRRQLAADHGWIGNAAAMPMRWPGGSGTAAQFALPAHRSLLIRQRGVLVHSRWAAESLREEIPALEVHTVPMGIPLGDEPDGATGTAFRRRYGLPVDRPILGCFGFQTPMKRTEVVIRALAEPGLENAHLMVAGEVAPILELDGTAAAAGVSDRVHVLGFLPFEDFEAAILASDVCLNLRYPTAGETSASLLRILALGRPAVVSDYAQSAELPPEGILKIPVGEGEVPALVGLLTDLLSDRSKLAAKGREARRYVSREHQPRAAGAAIAAACRELRESPPLSERFGGELREAVEPPPPTTLVWSSLEGELEVSGAEPPWREGERRRLTIRLKNRSSARWLAGERRHGGVALEARIDADGRKLRTERDWIGLPFDLDPGQEHVFEVSLRRPPGPAWLRILPHVLGHGSFAELDGPVWESEL